MKMKVLGNTVAVSPVSRISIPTCFRYKLCSKWVAIIQLLGCELHDLYCDMDGYFPNHEPDPTVLDNMGDLIKNVREHTLNVGIGIDVDGVRVVFDDGWGLGIVKRLVQVYGGQIEVEPKLNE